MPPMPREFWGLLSTMTRNRPNPKTSPQSRRALRSHAKKPKDFARKKVNGRPRSTNYRSLISPNRRIADQFLESLGRGRSKSWRICGRTRPFQTLIRGFDSYARRSVGCRFELDVAGELIKSVTSQPPVHVIGLHTNNDSDAILRSLRYGASEFLYAPFDVSIQEAAISRIQKLLQPSGGERESGKVVVFSSAKGGSGASTLMQTASALRRASGKRVLLADFDLMAGSLGFYLNLEQPILLVDLILSADHLDHDTWSTMTADADGMCCPRLTFRSPMR